MALPFKNLRSGECLRSFVDYCIKHPEERFWQALRNWCGMAGAVCFVIRPKELLRLSGHRVRRHNA
jgi:hypothetical protein